MTSQISFRLFEHSDAALFRRLNEGWITSNFALEPHDKLMLEHPVEVILQPGGKIFIVQADDQPIGCAALVPLKDGVWELAKMAVAPEHRGKGVGRKLLNYMIEQAKLAGAKALRLGSNRKLANAIHLYESVGFEHLPPERITPSKYTRTNVFMELPLAPSEE